MLFTRPARKILLVLFVAILWLPLVVMLATPQQEYSDFENRRLAPAPVLDPGTPRKFALDFESYFNDHFGFRQRLIHLFRLLEVRVFQVPQAGTVLFGKDDWLFQAGQEQVDDIRNNWPFTDIELAQWADVLEAKHNALKKRGIEYLFVFASNKHLVYPDKLPDSVNRVRDESRADQLVDYLSRHTRVPILDLRPALVDARVSLRPYHKTDTHWNAWGAYVGYRSIIERLQRHFPELSPIELGADDFAERTTPGWDLARALSMEEELTEVEVYPDPWEPDCAEYEGLPPEPTRWDRNNKPFTTRCESGSRRLLMFRDSYALALMPYLSETFEYIHYYPATPVPLDGMLEVVREQKPDIVIEQRSTRWLRRPWG